MSNVTRMPRTVTPMDRVAEDRLLALVEAAAAPLPRSEIYARVEDHFDDEEHLAKTLGRLVADGRLERSTRDRQGRPEFIYAVHRGNAARLAVVAAAVENVQAPATPSAKEKAMPKKQEASEDRYLNLLEARETWMGPKEIAVVLLEHAAMAGAALRDLAAQERIQTRGVKRGLRYAALGVSADDDVPAPKKTTAPRAPRKRAEAAPQKHVDPTPAPMQLPALNVQPGAIAWAIDDQGNVAIREGDTRILLTPKDCSYGVDFLEKTQLLWKRAA